MPAPESSPHRVGYYLAIALFVAILAFAVLGLVRSSTSGGVSSRERTSPPVPTRSFAANLPAPTAEIPPPTPSEPTRPPSVTYLYPPPETEPTAEPTTDPAAMAEPTAEPEPESQPRR